MPRIMKDSGIEWIGEIPENWEIIKAKNIFTNHKDIVGDKEADYERLSLTLNGVLKRPKNDNKGLQSENFSKYQILKKNELVFKMIDLENINTSRVGYSQYTGLVSPVYIIFNNEDYTKFGYYYFYSMYQRTIFNQLGNNGVRSALNVSDMLSLPFPKLSKWEAERIADFLDEKVAEIDSAIEKTKATIEDYKKYKQSIITETVTKGLNPEVEMKDSGIEWVGSIPNNWETRKLKQCVYVRARLGWKGLKADEYVKEGYAFLSAFNIINNKLDFSEINYINEFRYNESPEIKLAIGDVLLVKDGAGIGKCAYVESLPQEATVNGSIAVLSSNIILKGKYLYYYLLSKIMQKYVDRLKDGMGVPHLFQRDIKEIKIPIPTVNEQNEIIQFLDIRCAEIDNMIKSKEAILSEFESYKKSLIYEYVTGKKEIK